MKRLTTKKGTPISLLGFGAMQFGQSSDQSNVREIYEKCIDAGINHFDTAFSYSGGHSELILGGLLAHKDPNDIFIATKAPNDRPSSSQNLLDSLEESRKRLGIDTVDLYYLHRFDPNTSLEESFGTLANMQSKGKIRHIGVSNFAAWQFMKAQAVCAKFGTRIDAFQPMYNLVKRQVEVEILPACQDQGVAVCPYSPLGGGLLSGKYVRGANGRLKCDKTYELRYRERWMHKTARELSKLSKRSGLSAVTLAVAWVAHNSAITSTLISSRNVEQLQPSLDALRLQLSDHQYNEISGLSPIPPPATDRSELC